MSSLWQMWLKWWAWQISSTNHRRRRYNSTFRVVWQIWNMLRIFRIEIFLKGDIGRTTTESREWFTRCGGCGGAPTGKSKLRPDGEAELLELGNDEKNSLARRAMVDSSGKLAGGLTPVTSGPVGLPCRLL